MTAAIWTLATLSLIIIVIGIIDIIKELKRFCLSGVVSREDFESKRPVGLLHSYRRAFDFPHSENRLALKKQSHGLQAEHALNTISK